MPKFRKLPVVVDAFQYHHGDPLDGDDIVRGEGPYEVFIRTLEGLMQVGDGDWVITGVAAERYPCKDAIFQATYEPVGVTRITPEQAQDRDHAP